MMASRLLLSLCLLGGAASSVPAEAAPTPTVAVAKVQGPRRASPARLERGLKEGLAKGGVTVVDVGPANPKRDGFTAEAAKADAEFLVTVSISRSRRKSFARVRLYRVRDGEEVARTKVVYRRRSQAQRAGAKAGGQIALAAIDKAAPPPPPPPPPAPVVQAPPPAPPPPMVVAEPEPEPDAPSDLGDRERSVFHVRAGAGTQVASAYTVAVDGQVTGLAYTLSPLFLMTAGLGVQSPTLGLGGEAWLSFVPVSYQIDVDPPVSPRDPSGRFFDLGLVGTYQLELAQFGEEGSLYLKPLVGLGYASMTTEGQGGNSVVISYSTMDVKGGLRLGVLTSRSLAIELETRGGLVVLYDEGPTTTGDSGLGFNLYVGGQVRYWLNDLFGVFVGAGYTYQRVGMSGTGTRVGFVGDPVLTDATVFNGDVKISSGVQIGL